VLANQPVPYTDDELSTVATNCTSKGDAARKVERDMSKRIAAVAMSGRIGERFDAIVTGVTPHGTFVRVLQPHVEGLLVEGQQGTDVGDKLRVRPRPHGCRTRLYRLRSRVADREAAVPTGRTESRHASLSACRMLAC
jgi:exoribonuclease-2